jgi:Flp pilus assembly protein TadD
MALIPVMGLATVLRETDRAAEAEPMLKKAMDAAPGSVEALKEMARIKIALGRPDEAVPDANLAAAMAENDPEAQRLVMEVKVARALQTAASHGVDLGMRELTQLRDDNPDSATVRLGLGLAHIERRNGDAAIAELQKAVELDPTNAEAQYRLGYAWQVLKQNPASAVGPFEKAAAEPGNALYATSLGLALAAAQQLDRSVEVLAKATAAPGYRKPVGFMALGQAYVTLKRYPEAVAALEKATSLAPNEGQAWAALGWACFGLRDAEKFKEAAGKARSLGYNEPMLLDCRLRARGVACS